MTSWVIYARLIDFYDPDRVLVFMIMNQVFMAFIAFFVTQFVVGFYFFYLKNLLRIMYNSFQEVF